MKRFYLALVIAGLAFGCRSQVSDEDSIREILETDPLFSFLDVIDGNPDTTALKSLGPQTWYRHIYRDSVVKSYTINVVGDSAYVIGKWYLVGEFRVITGYDISGDSLTYVAKPLRDVAERHAIFKKIRRSWRLVKISALKFYPQDGSPAFSIDSVVVIGSSSGTKVFTDPFMFLDTSQIFYSPGESVEVRVYASNPDTAYAYIHHWRDHYHRDAMDYDSTSGYFVRSYTLTTRSGRYNAIADLIQKESFDTSSSTYLLEAWGFPYIVR